MNLIDMISNGILQSESKEKKKEITQIITFSGAYKDQSWTENFFLMVFQTLGLMFYPMAVGFGFPVILSNLGLEKEDRIADLMKINGMSSAVYIISNFVYYLLFFGLSSLIFMISGHFLLDEGLFHGYYLEMTLFMFLWNSLQIAFSLFIIKIKKNASPAIKNRAAGTRCPPRFCHSPIRFRIS